MIAKLRTATNALEVRKMAYLINALKCVVMGRTSGQSMNAMMATWCQEMDALVIVRLSLVGIVLPEIDTQKASVIE